MDLAKQQNITQVDRGRTTHLPVFQDLLSYVFDVIKGLLDVCDSTTAFEDRLIGLKLRERAIGRGVQPTDTLPQRRSPFHVTRSTIEIATTQFGIEKRVLDMQRRQVGLTVISGK